MNQLEEILSIPDKDTRVSTLVVYAQTLKVEVSGAHNDQGHLSESRLVVLIYDALKARQMIQDQKRGFFWGGLLLLGVLTAGIWLFLKFLGR